MNEDTIAVMDYLSNPITVGKMTNATNTNFLALSGIVSELEELFADSKYFPLYHNASDKNAKKRRNVGWMVRYVMREYGYSPIEKSDRTRIGSNSGSKYFGNVSLYQKILENPEYYLFSLPVVIGSSWKLPEMKLVKDDSDYLIQKERLMEIKRKIKEFRISHDFLLSYLHRIGFNNLINFVELEIFLNGLSVPYVELCDAIEQIVNLFEIMDECIENRKNGLN